MSSGRIQIVVFPFSLWGHARPIPAWVARVYKQSIEQCTASIEIACFVPLHVCDRFKLELTRQFGTNEEAEEALKSHIKLNTLDITSKWASPASYQQELQRAYHNLCASNESHPNVVVIDCPVKIVCWNPIAVSTMFGQPFRDFSIDMDAVYAKIAKVTADAVAKANTDADASIDVGYSSAANCVYESHLIGKTMLIPGLLPPVDYEGYPQEVSISDFSILQPRMTNIEYMENFVSNDGMICTWPYDLELEAFNAVDALARDRGSEVFSLGPFIPDLNAPKVLKAELEQSEANGIVQFLDSKPDKLILYISFGTIFFPEKLHKFIEVTLDMGIPLVLVQPAHAPPIPDTLKTRFSDDTKEAITDVWAPQQYILHHRAVGYFLSHNGLNSTVEALHVGMPMICWPHYGNQPFLAILIARYELSEVRQGLGLHTRGNGTTTTGTLQAVGEEAEVVLHQAFFNEEDRKEKSAAAMTLLSKLRSAWLEGGHADKVLDHFIDFVPRSPEAGRMEREAELKN
ncbi:hypothetical protein C8R43DRAFT_958150 [Mycena crocata]|nr:hypothetical protein C8R43DRAFT_958150 [Mycena crocata]